MKKGNQNFFSKVKVTHCKGRNFIKIFRITKEAATEQETAKLALEHLEYWENIESIEVLKTTLEYFCIEKFEITFAAHSTNGPVKTLVREVFAENSQEAGEILKELIARWRDIRKIDLIKIKPLPFIKNYELESQPKAQLKDIATFK